ncbi:MAG TPA: type II CAAX endopeptidase family protein [Pyrinomonadaceae bacterium]|jgi:membrane protease YdiL (CAAX protease family)|nr:type II CAAX endopeptidase family protein [Pyrinomonadaceae bacterium]
MKTGRQRSLWVALVAIAFFILAENMRQLVFLFPSFRAFYRAHPWQVGETVWKSLWILTALIGVMLAHRLGGGGGFRELGLARWPGKALAAALVATLPMLLVFATLLPVNPSLAVLPVWMTAVASPLSEEVLFRGYLFRQLYQRAQWPFWAAALMNVVPFTWGHLYQAGRSGLGGWGFVLVVLIMGSGAAIFAWLLVRWEYNLWFNIGLHSGMNLWWYVFAVDDSAFGGLKANIARLLTLALAVFITLRHGRYRATIPPAQQQLQEANKNLEYQLLPDIRDGKMDTAAHQFRGGRKRS